MSERSPKHEIEPPGETLPDSTDVLIVGAGLSGLTLLRDLQGAGINTVAIEESGGKDFKNAMYLVSKAIARKYGLESFGEGLVLINGAVTYNTKGQISDSIPPCETAGFGFVPLPHAILLEQLKGSATRPVIHYDTEFRKASENPIGDLVITTSTKPVKARLVIDATGWQSAACKIYYPDSDRDYIVRALYGETCETEGFNPTTLHFVDGLHKNTGNWVLPTGNQGAEVMAGHELPISRTDEWWEKHAVRAFDEMKKWYKDTLNKIIHADGGSAMAFREDLARREMFEGRVVPFGESAGLNSPYSGQLIDILPHYSQALTEIINQARRTNSWQDVGKNFYHHILENPPFFYLVHTIMRQNRLNGKSRVEANGAIIKALQKTFDQYTLWRIMQENGLSLGDFAKVLRKEPLAVLGWMIKSTPSFALCVSQNPDLMRQVFLTSRKRLLSRIRAMAL